MTASLNTSASHTALFESTKIGSIELSNRLAVAPMTRVSANNDGTANSQMQSYYHDFVKGGFGLIITECLYTDKAYSQCYRQQPGMSDYAQAESWRSTIQGVHKDGGAIIAQLAHGGAISQYNRYVNKTVAPSAVKPLGQQMTAYYGDGDYALPTEMSEQNIKDVVQGFADAALLAESAGFDGIEIHGANGYLLDQFLTTYTNQRQDQYGGSLSNRLRIHREIIRAIRAVVSPDFLVGIRFSQTKVNDTEYRWPEGEAAAKETFSLMGESGVDFIHTTEYRLDKPAFENSLSLAALAKQYSGLPVIANGGVDQPEQTESTLNQGHGDIIALGKIALSNPDWPKAIQSKKALVPFDYALLSPIANIENGNRYLAQQK